MFVKEILQPVKPNSLTRVALLLTLSAVVSMSAFGECSSEQIKEIIASAPDSIPGDYSRFERVWSALDAGRPVRIAVVGGSITEGAGASLPSRSWGEKMVAEWRVACPSCRIDFVNAGIGATGSDVGAFRLRQDVISKEPDVVIVEFSVNDANNRAAAESYEGVMRQLLNDPRQIAVAALGMMNETGDNAQGWHGKVAAHYGVPYISYRDTVHPFIKCGKIKWSDVSPDAIHPNDTGHALAAALVNKVLFRNHDEYKKGGRCQHTVPPLPKPMFGTSYDRGSFVRMGDVRILENKGFFELQDRCWGVGLACTNAHGRIAFEVEGSTVALLYRFGKEPFEWGKISVRMDGRVVIDGLDCFRDQWWWFTPSLLLCKDRPGKHLVEVFTKAEKNADSKGYGCQLTGVLVSE